MPRVELTGDDAFVEAALRARDGFDNGFRRSKRGNLWRNWEGKTLTIFKRDDGYFGWSIADNNGVRFSPGGYGSEAEAAGGLWDRTEGRRWR